jgi:predicted phage gp36 major capsid-like protein
MNADQHAMAVLAEQGQRWSALRAELEKLDDMDERTLLDTLEGETELLEAIAQIDEFILDAEADEAGAEAVITRLKDRKDRAARRQERLRTIVTQVMDSAGLKTAKTAGGTYTLREVAPAVVVEDESLIPSAYFTQSEPKISKSKINEAVKAGETVPGTRMSNGGISLTIRRA